MNVWKAMLFAFLAVFASSAFAATVSLDGLIQLVIYLVIIGLVLWLVWWLIGFAGIPEPFNKVARVVVGLVAVLILISILLGFIGHPIFTLK